LFSKNTVLSGGLDCQLAVYTLERGARSLRAVRKVMPLPRHGSVSSSSSGRHNVLAQISGSGVLDLFRGDIGVGSDAALELVDAVGGLGFELAVRVEPPKVRRAPAAWLLQYVHFAAFCSEFLQDSAWQLVALSGDCKYMALSCSRSIVLFACNVSALLWLPPPVRLPHPTLDTDQRRYAFYNSSVCLRNFRSSVQHCIRRAELPVRRRQPGRHPRARPRLRLQNARNSAVCDSSRRNYFHVQLSCAFPPIASASYS
jgi:hypothetical protein